MSRIENNADRYNTNTNYISYFTSIEGTPVNSFSLIDYASIKNGSYEKLLKAYYGKQNIDKNAKLGDSPQKSLLIKTSADALKKSAEMLVDKSLWEKKKIIKKNEQTGKETEIEDYDREAITKAIKVFVDDYNSVVEAAGKSDAKAVLRNTLWMTNMTNKVQNLLEKTGITVGKGNKLEVDIEELKKSHIGSLKTLFTGYGSFVDKIVQKAGNISIATGNNNEIYTRRGRYSSALSELICGKVDEEV